MSDDQVVFGPGYVGLLQGAGLADYASIITTAKGRVLTKPGLGDRQRIRLNLPAENGTVHTIYLKRYADPRTAEEEWLALQAVRAAGVPTMEPVAMGAGDAGGFVMVSGVPGEALERCLGDLLARRGRDAVAMTALARALGRLAGQLHAARLAHRDFYTSHIFLDELDRLLEPVVFPEPHQEKAAAAWCALYLIDLARVFRPRWRQWRWRVKDLAQLKFSLPAEWTFEYWPAVMDAYGQTLGRHVPARAAPAIQRRVVAMRREQARRVRLAKQSVRTEDADHGEQPPTHAAGRSAREDAP